MGVERCYWKIERSADIIIDVGECPHAQHLPYALHDLMYARELFPFHDPSTVGVYVGSHISSIDA